MYGKNIIFGYGKISEPLHFSDYTAKDERGDMADFLRSGIKHHNKEPGCLLINSDKAKSKSWT